MGIVMSYIAPMRHVHRLRLIEGNNAMMAAQAIADAKVPEEAERNAKAERIAVQEANRIAKAERKAAAAARELEAQKQRELAKAAKKAAADAKVLEAQKQRELAKAAKKAAAEAKVLEARTQRALAKAAKKASERAAAEAKEREARKQRALAKAVAEAKIREEKEANAEKARVLAYAQDVLAQLPKTKAFKKVTLDDATMAVYRVEEASSVIRGQKPDYLKQVDIIFDAFVKSMAKEHVAIKMINVQGLNLKTGVIHGSEASLRDAIAKEKEIKRKEQIERQSKYKKCVVCRVGNAFRNADEPEGPWDVTHCVECADPDVHVHFWEYPDSKTERVRLENVMPYKYACASLV
jgi:ferredoxin-like protein FixX